MIRKPNIQRVLVLPLIGMLLVISSCRTIPERPYPDLLGWLPPESDLMIRLQVPGNEALTSLILASSGMDTSELDQIIDRAALVVVGIEVDGDKPVIHLATLGAWPRGVMGSALGTEWTKAGRYRWDGPDGLELTLPTGNELILSTGKADLMIARANSGEPSMVESEGPVLLQNPDLEIWMNNPSAFMDSDGLLGALIGSGLEISQMNVVLNKIGESSYSVNMSIVPGDPAASRGLALVFRFGMSARFGLSPVPEERDILKLMNITAEAGAVNLYIEALDMGVLGTLLGELGISMESSE